MIARKFPTLIASLLFMLGGNALAADSLAQRVDALYLAIEADVIDAPTINANALRQDKARPIFVDVRSAKERAVSNISGAISLAELPAALQSAKRPVVVYCTVGYRSGLAVLDLQKRGIAARNLRGGILAWLAAGGQIVDADGKQTHKVHVYGKSWAVLPEGFEAVY
jgi:rhodanese-related sulfurtransferase